MNGPPGARLADPNSAGHMTAKPSTPRMAEIQEHLEEQMRPLVESCFSRMNRRQWSSLLSLNLDENSKSICKDFLDDLVVVISRFLQEMVKSLDSREIILSIIGDLVPRVFAKVLDIEENVISDNAERLTELIIEEAMERLRCADHEQSDQQCDQMVSHCTKVLKDMFFKKKLTAKKRQDMMKGLPAGLEKFSTSSSSSQSSGKGPPSDEGGGGGARKGRPGSGSPPTRAVKHLPMDYKVIVMEEFVEKLVRKIFKRSKVACFQENFEFYRRRIFNKLWAEARPLHCHVDQKNFRDMHEIIYNDLEDMLNLDPVTGLFTDLEQDLFEDVLVRLFKYHLVRKPPVPSEVHIMSRIESIREKERAMPVRRRRVWFEDEDDLKGVTVVGLRLSQPPSPASASLSGSYRSDEAAKHKRENCNLLINKFLTMLIPYTFKKVDIPCSKDNFDLLFSRMYDKLWDLCRAYDFTVVKDNVRNLEKITYKNMRNYVVLPECMALVAMDPKDPPCDIIVAKTFEKHMLKRKTWLKRLVEYLADLPRRPFRPKPTPCRPKPVKCKPRVQTPRDIAAKRVPQLQV